MGEPVPREAGALQPLWEEEPILEGSYSKICAD